MATTPKTDGDSGAVQLSFTDKLREYVRTLTFEWKKISYPDKQQLTQSTIVVFIFVMVFIAVISVYDWVVGRFFTTLILPPS